LACPASSLLAKLSFLSFPSVRSLQHHLPTLIIFCHSFSFYSRLQQALLFDLSTPYTCISSSTSDTSLTSAFFQIHSNNRRQLPAPDRRIETFQDIRKLSLFVVSRNIDRSKSAPIKNLSTSRQTSSRPTRKSCVTACLRTCLCG
jgi:hypothetical protein